MKLDIDNVRENKDGSVDVDIEYDDEALLLGKAWASRWHPDMTDEMEIMHAYVINILEEHVKGIEEEQDANK
jgi:hypothetical protein